MLRWKVYFSFKFQALAPIKGFGVSTDNEIWENFGRVGTRQEQFSFMWFALLRWFGRAVLSQKNVGKPTKAAVNVPVKILSVWRCSQSCRTPSEINSLRVQQQVLGSILRENTHEASGNSDFLLDFLLSWASYEHYVMSRSQVKGGATNAVLEWTKKQGLPRILTTSHRCLYALLTGQLIN